MQFLSQGVVDVNQGSNVFDPAAVLIYATYPPYLNFRLNTGGIACGNLLSLDAVKNFPTVFLHFFVYVLEIGLRFLCC